MLTNKQEVSPELLLQMWDRIKATASKYNLTYSEPRIEIVNAEQMLINHVSMGLPNMYDHWSFGKNYFNLLNRYLRGHAGVAYEQIIPSDPPLCYILNTNSIAKQLTVLIHAGIGHASFFKNNYMFTDGHSDPRSSLDIAIQLTKAVKKAELKLGRRKTELLLDAFHALSPNSFYKSKANAELTEKQQDKLTKEKNEHEQLYVNLAYDAASPKGKETPGSAWSSSASLSDNILDYTLQNSRYLDDTVKHMLQLYLELNQTMYPYYHTKIMNEGWASFWEYHIINELFDEGYIDESIMFDYISTHGGVHYQGIGGEYIGMSDWGTPHRIVNFHPQRFHLNPYHLGVHIFNDIKKRNPDNWQEKLIDIMENYRDVSFIKKYLSDELISELGLVSVEESYARSNAVLVQVTNIANEEGYDNIRKIYSDSIRLESFIPQIFIEYSEKANDITLWYNRGKDNPVELDKESLENMVKYIRSLWGGIPVSTVTHN